MNSTYGEPNFSQAFFPAATVVRGQALAYSARTPQSSAAVPHAPRAVPGNARRPRPTALPGVRLRELRGLCWGETHVHIDHTYRKLTKFGCGNF